MWTPNMTTPVVKMLCHRSTVTAMAFDLTGNYLVTAGSDSQIHVWDARKFGKKMHSYFTPGNTAPATSLDLSQNNMLAVGFGSHVQIWRDALQTKQKRPYMQHELAGPLSQDVHFCPFEDVLGVSHEKGFESLIVPGSGIANFDTFEANPFSLANKKQRQEAEVQALLEKLKPEMIMLDPNQIGTMDRADHKVIAAERYEEQLATATVKEKKERKRGRGRSTAIKRFLRKSTNVRDEKREKILNAMKERKEKKEEQKRHDDGSVPKMLARFKA